LHTVGPSPYEGVIFGCKDSFCSATQIITLKSLINCSDSGMLYSLFAYCMSVIFIICLGHNCCDRTCWEMHAFCVMKLLSLETPIVKNTTYWNQDLFPKH